MSANFLSLNDSKTEIITFGPSKMSDTDGVNMGTLSPFSKHQGKKLGVICDSALKCNFQISEVVKASFYQLRMISKIKPLLVYIDVEKLVHI